MAVLCVSLGPVLCQKISGDSNHGLPSHGDIHNSHTDNRNNNRGHGKARLYSPT